MLWNGLTTILISDGLKMTEKFLPHTMASLKEELKETYRIMEQQTKEIDYLKRLLNRQYTIIEDKNREISDDGWLLNPDRVGG